MYTLSCDGFPLLDVRDEELMVIEPKVKVETNTVGEGSFMIYNNHPYYDKLKKLKSVFEVSDDVGVIFRGRMTDDTVDFYNGKAVDLEGAMAFFNDSIVRPFAFPDDFLANAGYLEASKSGNVVEFFLKWLIENHNSQTQPFQHFKLGNVTVGDPNNYITRSNESHANTWETLKSKLFESSLGGFLCIRYEDDGNYIDYLADFELTNTQVVEFGENLLDLTTESSAAATYSAAIPLGNEKLTIESLADGDVTDDIVKKGDTLYSKSAVEKYGWIYAPVDETTWDDVTDANNLLKKCRDFMINAGTLFSDTIEITAADLHFTDEQIQSFRIYRNIRVNSRPHGHEGLYQLTMLDIDLLNPQNTKITVGDTQLTLTDSNSKKQAATEEKIFSIVKASTGDVVHDQDYQEFKESVEAQLDMYADELVAKFKQTFEEINSVNGDLQSKFTELYKYFSFSVDGLVIGSGNSAITLTLDNDRIVFKKNGYSFGWWDGNEFHTGNIVVEVNERAQFGNFAFVPRSDGSLSFLKVV